MGSTEVAWADDRQVAEVCGRRGDDEPENARTEVWVYRLNTRLPSKDLICRNCRKSFQDERSQKNKRLYCSPACRTAATSTKRSAECSNCGKSFKPEAAKQEYCSVPCKNEALTVALTCIVCGKGYRMAQSLANAYMHLCSSGCRTVYWREHRKVAGRGTCSECGGPTSKKTYTRCRPCFYKKGYVA